MPHYGFAEIDAENDAAALVAARDYDLSEVTIEPEWENSVCTRIVHIENASGKTVFYDVPLDDYFQAHRFYAGGPSFSWRRAVPRCRPRRSATCSPGAIPGNHGHPTEKSVDTQRLLVEAFSKPGDVVPDASAGSGSRLVAAALLGQNYIGIELEPKYCEIARRKPPTSTIRSLQPLG